MSKLTDVKFVFYHIEKCAGTSFRYALYDYFKNFINIKDIYIPDLLEQIKKNNSIMNSYDLNYKSSYDRFLLLNLNPKILLCHCRYNELNFTDTIPKNSFKFAIIRSPYDRFISYYNFFTYPNTNKELNHLDINDLINLIKKQSNVMTNYFSGNTNNLELAKKNLSNFDFIIDFKNINEIHTINSFNNKLNKYFNVNYQFNLPKVKHNPSQKKYQLNNDVKQIIINQIKLSNDYKLFLHFKIINK